MSVGIRLKRSDRVYRPGVRPCFAPHAPHTRADLAGATPATGCAAGLLRANQKKEPVAEPALLGLLWLLTPPLLAGDCVGMHRLRLGPGLQHEPLWDQGTRHGHGADAAQPQERRALRGARPRQTHGTRTATTRMHTVQARAPARKMACAHSRAHALPRGKFALSRCHRRAAARPRATVAATRVCVHRAAGVLYVREAHRSAGFRL